MLPERGPKLKQTAIFCQWTGTQTSNPNRNIAV